MGPYFGPKIPVCTIATHKRQIIFWSSDLWSEVKRAAVCHKDGTVSFRFCMKLLSGLHLSSLAVNVINSEEMKITNTSLAMFLMGCGKPSADCLTVVRPCWFGQCVLASESGESGTYGFTYEPPPSLSPLLSFPSPLSISFLSTSLTFFIPQNAWIVPLSLFLPLFSLILSSSKTTCV